MRQGDCFADLAALNIVKQEKQNGKSRPPKVYISSNQLTKEVVEKMN
jgi:hypothetical protein